MKLSSTFSVGILVLVGAVVGPTVAMAVTPSNLTNSPARPTYFDDVNIGLDLTPAAGESITNAIAWFRLGTNGIFDSLTMTNADSHWSTVTPISHPDLGTVQYAIQYFVTNSSGVVTQAFYPVGGTNAAAVFQVNLPADVRSETFEVDWPNVPWGKWANLVLFTAAYSNAVNPTTQWGVNNICIRNEQSNSVTFFAMFPSSASTGDTGIASAMLTNEISAITFRARNVAAGHSALIGIESCFDPSGTTWVTNMTMSVATNGWASFSATNLLYPTSNQFIRIRKYSLGTAASLYIDDIAATYPPANVAISNVFINPGYPATSDSVRVSCEVTSINPMFPAYGISPSVYYRAANIPTWTTIPMVRVSGNRYETSAALPIPPQSRDTEIKYFIRCDFRGYHGSAPEDRSPRYFPSGNSASPLNYFVRAFVGAYSNASTVVNGTYQPARMLSDWTWQSVATLASTSSSLTLSFAGYGYSDGLGYSTNAVTWGNSNNWQTTLPLADVATVGQTNLTIPGTFRPGQYVIRFNERTGEYIVQECVWQDFDNWVGTAGKYVKSVNGSLALMQNNFDTWPTNVTHTRTESFTDTRWTDYPNYVDGGAGGDDKYAIFGSKIFNQSVVTTTNGAKGNRFVVQASRQGNPLPDSPYYPLRGIGTISYQFSVPSSNACTIAAYFYTNAIALGDELEYKIAQRWTPTNALLSNSNVTNTGGLVSRTISVKTNASYDVIFSQDSGNDSVTFDNLSVSEWYAETFSSNGWVAQEAWIEGRPAFPFGNVVRLEASRASPFGTDQYIQTPAITNGINTFSFSYSAGSTNPVAFDVQISFDTPDAWSNITATVTNTIANPGSNYVSFSQTLMIDLYDHPYIYLRVKNATPLPGSLLLDDFKVSPYGGATDWRVNNCAIDDSDQTFPPATRQFYAGACYINSNRVANIDTNELTRPNTNTYPAVTAPVLEHGIGDVSFWYRNWATSGVPLAAQLVIQTAATDSTNDADWRTVGIVTNIVNTNDYRYFVAPIYDPTSRFVRIFNNDTGTVGRVCIDDLLVTTPIATSLAMSNLVTSPSAPVFSNEVDVIVDVYHLFLAPSNLILTAYYATGTNYPDAVNSSVTPRAMTCIASNMSVPGKWYRYQTRSDDRIPTNAIDKFVSYSVRATFDGCHTEVTSPTTNRQFGRYPTWLRPMPEITNNIAFYPVFSCPTGAVWINEFNVIDDTDPRRYVELCGRTGASIRDWRLQVLYSGGTTNADYTITNGTPLPNGTNGFGFWVVGNSSTPRNLTLTNTLPTTAGGLRLLRSCGAAADALSYGMNVATVGTLTNMGIPHIGTYDDDWFNIPVALIGSNTTGFAWSNDGLDDSYTPGGINQDEYLFGQAVQNEPPTIGIVALWINTNVWINSTTTNSWYPTLWQTTNLLATNSWTIATNSTMSQPSATNCLFNLPVPPGVAPRFYRVVATNGP